MTRDEVIRMAREAGLVDAGLPIGAIDALERFAVLVKAAERERCAKIVEQYTGAWNDEGFALAAKIRKGE